MKFTSRDPIALVVLLDSNVPEPSTPDGTVLRELQLAVVGEFVSGKYGRFKITESDMDTMIAHYGRVYPLHPTELCVDYDHLSTPDPTKPRTPGDGKAAGWIKRIFKKATTLAGKAAIGLFAEIEYTANAAKMIRDKEYRFFSPTFVKEWATNTGQKVGATLLGGALTNHPFLHGMGVVTASTEPIVQLSGIVALPISDAHAGAPTMSKKTITVKNEAGEDVVVALDSITAHDDVKAALAPKPEPKPEPKAEPKPGDPPVALSAADVTKIVTDAVTAATAPLVGQVTTLSADLNAIKTERSVNQFETKFSDLLKAGKVVPAQKDQMKTLADLNFDAWSKSMDAAPVVVKLGGAAQPVGNHTEPSAPDNDDVQNEMDAKVKELQAKNPAAKLSYTEALAQVSRDHPDLARKFQLSFRES